MKRLFGAKFMKGLLLVPVLLGTLTLAAPTAHAAGSCNFNGRFLTFPTWWRGIPTDTATCSLNMESIPPERLVSIIAANIAEVIIQLVGYASAIFIIVGGFKYITSSGSPDGMTSARKTIQNAVIGLLISILSVGIVNIVFSRL